MQFKFAQIFLPSWLVLQAKFFFLEFAPRTTSCCCVLQNGMQALYMGQAEGRTAPHSYLVFSAPRTAGATFRALRNCVWMDQERGWGRTPWVYRIHQHIPHGPVCSVSPSWAYCQPYMLYTWGFSKLKVLILLLHPTGSVGLPISPCFIHP